LTFSIPSKANNSNLSNGNSHASNCSPKGSEFGICSTASCCLLRWIVSSGLCGHFSLSERKRVHPRTLYPNGVSVNDNLTSSTRQSRRQRPRLKWPSHFPREPTYQVIEFPTPSSGLASPVNRLDPGFIGGGRTAGGAREFVLPNGPIPPGATIRTVP
jgi:Novel toxin 10